MSSREDRELGLTREIPRRDFVGGVLRGGAGAWLGGTISLAYGLGFGVGVDDVPVRPCVAPPAAGRDGCVDARLSRAPAGRRNTSPTSSASMSTSGFSARSCAAVTPYRRAIP